MKSSTDTTSQSATVWWFPEQPQDKQIALALRLPKGQANPDPGDYPMLLASRIQNLADLEDPERLQELAEDAGLFPEDIGAQVVEQSELIATVAGEIQENRRPRRTKEEQEYLSEAANEMDLEAILGDLT